MAQAVHALKYLETFPNTGIRYECTPMMDVKKYIQADASHLSHPDGFGHCGMLFIFAGGAIEARSYKMKIMALSPMEAEHVVLCDAATYETWVTDMMCKFEVSNVRPLKIFQDNTSTIWMTSNEGNFARNKHMLVRKNYVKEAVLDGVVKILYQPTECMTADMLTKPLPKALLYRHYNGVGMAKIPITSVHDEARTSSGVDNSIKDRVLGSGKDTVGVGKKK
jgi:hypothetical protein